jgi:hypothetical protein
MRTSLFGESTQSIKAPDYRPAPAEMSVGPAAGQATTPAECPDSRSTLGIMI